MSVELHLVSFGVLDWESSFRWFDGDAALSAIAARRAKAQAAADNVTPEEPVTATLKDSQAPVVKAGKRAQDAEDISKVQDSVDLAPSSNPQESILKLDEMVPSSWVSPFFKIMLSKYIETL